MNVPHDLLGSVDKSAMKRRLLVLSFIGIILCIAAILMALFGQPGGYERDNDPFEYAWLGESLVAGNGLQFQGTPDVILPPGFPFLVSVFGLLSKNLGVAVRLASLSGFLLCLLAFYKATNVMFGLFISRLSLVLFCGSSGVLINAVSGYADSLFAGLMWLLVWLIAPIRRRSIFTDASFVTVWWMTFLTKPEGFLVGLLLIGFYLINQKARLFRGSIMAICFCILIFPYVYFLRATTGYWQLSGKSYANIVLGELDSPYQTGGGFVNARYDIIPAIQENPTNALPVGSYMNDPRNDLVTRIPSNVINLLKILVNQISVLGLLVILIGFKYLPLSSRWMLLGLCTPLILYSVFFYQPRLVSMYHGVFMILIASGLFNIKERLSDFKRYPISLIVFPSITVVIILYLIRSAVKLALQGV
ncbi:MAG: hypothetical protein KDC45_11225 [Bacteroidetes bacterium]|nr:hypothetical protein [Bacteroidota bacterium]